MQTRYRAALRPEKNVQQNLYQVEFHGLAKLAENLIYKKSMNKMYLRST
jgi:hypothetical protein